MPFSLDFLRGPGFLQNLLEEMQQQQLASQLEPQRRDPFDMPDIGMIAGAQNAPLPMLGPPTPDPIPYEYTDPYDPNYITQGGQDNSFTTGTMEQVPEPVDPYGHVRELLSEALGGIGPAEGTPTEASIAAYRQKNKWPRLLSQLGAIFASMGTSPMLGKFLGAQAARYAGQEHQMRQQMEDDAVRQQALRQKLLGSEIGVEADIAQYQAGGEERQARAQAIADRAKAAAEKEVRIREGYIADRKLKLQEHEFRVDQARIKLEEKYLNAETDEEAETLELEIKKLRKIKAELDIEGKKLDNERKRLGDVGFVPSAADQAALDASETY